MIKCKATDRPLSWSENSFGAPEILPVSIDFYVSGFFKIFSRYYLSFSSKKSLIWKLFYLFSKTYSLDILNYTYHWKYRRIKYVKEHKISKNLKKLSWTSRYLIWKLFLYCSRYGLFSQYNFKIAKQTSRVIE